MFYSRKTEESHWEQWNWWHFNLPYFSCPPQHHSNLENKHLWNYSSYENQQPTEEAEWILELSCPLRITSILSFWHLSEKLHSPELSLFDSQLTMPKALSWVYLSETISGNCLTWQFSSDSCLRSHYQSGLMTLAERLKRKAGIWDVHRGFWKPLIYS